MKLQRYLIERPVVSASGSQIFYVDATSEEDALEKHKSGKGDIYENECEVTSLGEPFVMGKTKLDDFGAGAEDMKEEDFRTLVNLLREISGTLKFTDPLKERILLTLVGVNALTDG